MTRQCRKRTTPPKALVVAIVCCLAGAAAGQDFVPFVIPARISAQQSIWVKDYQPIETKSERLRADEHFYRDQQVRIWGVNLTFGANFPSHEDAPMVAERLAAAGVNSVRLHHVDTSRWPRGIWEAKEGKTIEPQALERLDFFINELAKRGIFVNLNLHVGRAHSRYLGLPETNTEYDKIVGIFTPALVDAQKQYAKDLLTRVNRYRGGVRYADDPAIAFVEITNEDSFFMWDGDEKLRTLPPYYGQILQQQFNSWLRRRYVSDEALASAWGKGVEPLSRDMVYNGRFILWNADRKLPEHWNLEQHEGCQATLSHAQNVPQDAVQIEVVKANATQWHLQLTQGGFKVTKGRYYTLSFNAAARAKRPIGCVVSQAHSPWANLGLSRSVNLSTEGQTFRFGFVATEDDENARISLAFSGDSTPFHLTRVELRQGGQVGLAEGESPGKGSAALFHESETTARALDRMIFLAETEKAYFDGMRSYIKKDLGCEALVTGTIVFGPLGLYAQSDMDYIDSHSYWQHPTFPGRPWDSTNWLIEQKPMTDHPDQATLFRIAAERLAGKPFTLSEYNHPAPLDAQAECVPMVASYAAAQDWDGVWLFDYASGMSDWNRQTLSGFFSIDTNPAKWGFMRAGAALFRQRCISPLPGPVFLGNPQSEKDMLLALAQRHFQHGGDMFTAMGVQRETRLKGRQVTSLKGPWGHRDYIGPATKIEWDVKNGAGLYAVQSWAGSVYVGHAARLSEATDKKITILQPSFVALTITGFGGKDWDPLERQQRILITACGRCENVGMQFSPDRRTVGRNWGGAPVRIEAVRGALVVPDGKWTCHALAPDGSPKQQVPIVYENGRGTLTLSPEYGTMWYLLEQSP